MKNILQKIRDIFSSHYAMERFGILFFSLTFCMAILLGTMEIKRHKDNRKTLSEQVVYTTSVTTSLTSQTGSVQKILHNEDRTKCFILLKFIYLSHYSFLLSASKSSTNSGASSILSDCFLSFTLRVSA